MFKNGNSTCKDVAILLSHFEKKNSSEDLNLAQDYSLTNVLLPVVAVGLFVIFMTMDNDTKPCNDSPF